MHMFRFDIAVLSSDSLHDDIVVELGDWRQVGDTYWLEEFAGGVKASHADARSLLARAVGNWIAVLEGTSNLQMWFPILIFDQCSTWLQVACEGSDTVVMMPGWSTIEGHLIDPALSPTTLAPLNWTAKSTELRASKQAFMDRLRSIQADLCI